jgi:uncharacterized protein YjbJ (UPF0337 family)
MTGRQIEGFTQRVRGKVRELWGSVTDDDLDRAQGNLDQLVGTIKQKSGESEEAIRSKISNMLSDG